MEADGVEFLKGMLRNRLSDRMKWNAMNFITTAGREFLGWRELIEKQ